jgi:hypothetical protein
MWNPFHRLVESDRRRLARIERELSECTDQVTLVSERLIRLDARLRKRSNRALIDSAPAADDAGDSASGDGAPQFLPRLVEPAEAATEVAESPPMFTKEQLRDAARRRGMLPH